MESFELTALKAQAEGGRFSSSKVSASLLLLLLLLLCLLFYVWCTKYIFLILFIYLMYAFLSKSFINRCTVYSYIYSYDE